jgi:hypothetical protein
VGVVHIEMPHGLLFARSLKILAAMGCHGAGVSSAHFKNGFL